MPIYRLRMRKVTAGKIFLEGKNLNPKVYSVMKDSGLYQLLIRLNEARRITVGKLGTFDFPAGWYIYTGSAKRGLSARIGRHLRREKCLHWHIDYLLQHARIVGIKKYLTTARKECSLNITILNSKKAKTPVKKFGSSDCRCETHLVYFTKKPNIKFDSVKTEKDKEG